MPATATASRKPKGYEVDPGQAHESALKEAETDAMKRALMTFGNPFGLALHDKAQRQVSSDGRRVPHFRPRRYVRWSQSLAVTFGEVMAGGEPPLVKKRRELTREQAIKLWAQKRQ